MIFLLSYISFFTKRQNSQGPYHTNVMTS